MTTHSSPPQLPPSVVLPLLASMAITLHLVGPGPVSPTPIGSLEAWTGFVDSSAPVHGAFRALRLAALAACYHLLAMQVLASLARTVDRPGLARFADRFTPPPLRTTARRIAGIGLTAVTTIALPATRVGADPGAGRVVVQVVDLGGGTATVTVVPAPDAPEYVDPPGTAVLRVEATTQAPEEPPEDRSHEVRPGDHLWSIAEAEVALASGGATDQDAIQRHWHRILLANSQVEDPDLLFPGDVITLPPVGHTG